MIMVLKESQDICPSAVKISQFSFQQRGFDGELKMNIPISAININGCINCKWVIFNSGLQE